MPDILTKIFTSKAFSITTLSVSIFLIIAICIFQVQDSIKQKKIESLQNQLDSKDEVIVNLNQQISLKDLEIQYLEKGISISNQYEKEKEQILNEGSDAREQALQISMSSEENSDWWNTAIPDDVLNLFTCHELP